MNHYKRNNGAVIHALGLLVAAVTALGLLVAAVTTAAIGLTAYGGYKGQQVLSINPTAQSSDVAAKDGSAPSLPAGARNDDPELMRIDRGNEHHG